jgi:uncharacterized MAPEG superfamily protein
MTIAYYCVLFMGLLPIVAAGIAKKGLTKGKEIKMNKGGKAC